MAELMGSEKEMTQSNSRRSGGKTGQMANRAVHEAEQDVTSWGVGAAQGAEAGMATGGALGAASGGITGWGVGVTQGALIGLVIGVFLGLALHRHP